MAVIAPFTHVKITPFLLQGCIGLHLSDPVTGTIDPFKWSDHGNRAADHYYDKGQNYEDNGILFQHDIVLAWIKFRLRLGSL
jgi:hypothetical protein